MPSRVCLGCPRIIPRDSYKGRCAECNRKRDRERGTKAERGYGADYQAARRRYVALQAAGTMLHCWRCGAGLTDFHFGHDDHDRSVIRGPECGPCNLSAAGRASHEGGG